MSKLTITIEVLIEQIADNPIEGAKAAQKRNVGVRHGTYESAVSAGALYRSLKGSPKLISAFYSLPFWERASQRDPKHLNKHCHQFVYGARDGSEGKRAEDHAYATQSYLDDETMTVDQLLKALKEVGFDGLKKAAPAQKKRNAQAKQVADTPDRATEDDGEPDEEEEEDAPPPPTRKLPAVAGAELPKKLRPPITMKEVFEHLLVAMEEHELQQFLPDESDVGDRFQIVVERGDNTATGMLVWRAIAIDLLHAASA